MKRTAAALLLALAAGSTAQAATVVCPAITSRATMNVLVPAYVYPGDTPPYSTYWDKIVADAAIAKAVGFKLIVVVNPSNGDFTIVDPQYTAVIDRLDAAGALVVGYVYSSWGARSSTQITANIKSWRALYPKVKGIFFDEVQMDTAHYNYYWLLRRTIVQQFGGEAFVIGNAHGAQLSYTRYRDVFDVTIAFEGTGGTLPSFVQQSLVRYAAPRDIAYVVNTVGDYAAADAQSRACSILQSLRYSSASARNAGNWFLTTDTGANAYDTLGTEHDAMIEATCWANSLKVCPR